MRATSCLCPSVQARGERWLSEGPCSDEPPPRPRPSPSALPAWSSRRASAHGLTHERADTVGFHQNEVPGVVRARDRQGVGGGSTCLTGTVSVWEDAGPSSGDGRWGWLRDYERASCSWAVVKVVKMANLWYVYFTAVEKVGVAPRVKKAKAPVIAAFVPCVEAGGWTCPLVGDTAAIPGIAVAWACLPRVTFARGQLPGHLSCVGSRAKTHDCGSDRGASAVRKVAGGLV